MIYYYKFDISVSEPQPKNHSFVVNITCLQLSWLFQSLSFYCYLNLLT